MRLIAGFKKVLLGIEEPADGSNGEVKTVDEKDWRVRDIFWWPVETEELAKRAVFVAIVFTTYLALTPALHLVSLLFSGKQFRYGEVLQAAMLSYYIVVILGLYKLNLKIVILGLIISLLMDIVPFLWAINEKLSLDNFYLSVFFRYIFLALIYLHGIRAIKFISENNTYVTKLN